MYLAAMGSVFFFGLVCSVFGFAISKGQLELALAIAGPGVAALLATSLRMFVGMRLREEPTAFRVAAAAEFAVGLLWILFMIASSRRGAALASLYWTCGITFMLSGIGALLSSLVGRSRSGQRFLRMVTAATGVTLGSSSILVIALGLHAWSFAR
jgi:hypothetical protein